MTRYAADTKVTPARSRTEIEAQLTRYGATGFGYATQGDRAAIEFEIQHRRVRIILNLPRLEEFTWTEQSRRRSASGMKTAHEQAVRQRWRALALVIKAKLEAVESGISTIEQEFMAHVVLPSGATIGEWLAPQIEAAYRTQEMPPLLPGPSFQPGTVRLREVE